MKHRKRNKKSKSLNLSMKEKSVLCKTIKNNLINLIPRNLLN